MVSPLLVAVLSCLVDEEAFHKLPCSSCLILCNCIVGHRVCSQQLILTSPVASTMSIYLIQYECGAPPCVGISSSSKRRGFRSSTPITLPGPNQRYCLAAPGCIWVLKNRRRHQLDKGPWLALIDAAVPFSPVHRCQI